MTSNLILYAGIDISSGRRPVTFAALDDALNVVTLMQWTIPEVLACLNEYESVQLAINLHTSKAGHELYAGIQKELSDAGFKPYSEKNSSRLWIESDAQECYRVFQEELLPRRTLEGRIQRALILYEEGLQMNDPMDFYEEITRHKLMQGTLPTENIHSSKQLDALVMAYVSWLAGNPAENPTEKVVIRNELMVPKIIEND